MPRVDLRCSFWGGGEASYVVGAGGPQGGVVCRHTPDTGQALHRTPWKPQDAWQGGRRRWLGQKDVVARASGLLEFASSRRDDPGFLRKHLPSPPRGPWSPCDSGRLLAQSDCSPLPNLALSPSTGVGNPVRPCACHGQQGWLRSSSPARTGGPAEAPTLPEEKVRLQCPQGYPAFSQRMLQVQAFSWWCLTRLLSSEDVESAEQIGGAGGLS